MVNLHNTEQPQPKDVSMLGSTKFISLTEASSSKKDTSYSISITLPRHPDDDAAGHDAEQGCAHP